MAEARSLLGDTITAALQAVFDRDVARWSEDESRVGRVPALVFVSGVDADGAPNPGHDPSRAPQVPRAGVEVRRDADDGAVIYFTYKVEQGHRPEALLRVPRNWLSSVAGPGYAVVGGFPILEILERDDSGRPVVARVAVINGFFDATMHGWRGDAHTYRATVTWSGSAAAVEPGTFLS